MPEIEKNISRNYFFIKIVLKKFEKKTPNKTGLMVAEILHKSRNNIYKHSAKLGDFEEVEFWVNPDKTDFTQYLI